MRLLVVLGDCTAVPQALNKAQKRSTLCYFPIQNAPEQTTLDTLLCHTVNLIYKWKAFVDPAVSLCPLALIFEVFYCLPSLLTSPPSCLGALLSVSSCHSPHLSWVLWEERGCQPQFCPAPGPPLNTTVRTGVMLKKLSGDCLICSLHGSFAMDQPACKSSNFRFLNWPEQNIYFSEMLVRKCSLGLQPQKSFINKSFLEFQVLEFDCAKASEQLVC